MAVDSTNIFTYFPFPELDSVHRSFTVTKKILGEHWAKWDCVKPSASGTTWELSIGGLAESPWVVHADNFGNTCLIDEWKYIKLKIPRHKIHLSHGTINFYNNNIYNNSYQGYGFPLNTTNLTASLYDDTCEIGDTGYLYIDNTETVWFKKGYTIPSGVTQLYHGVTVTKGLKKGDPVTCFYPNGHNKISVRDYETAVSSGDVVPTITDPTAYSVAQPIIDWTDPLHPKYSDGTPCPEVDGVFNTGPIKWSEAYVDSPTANHKLYEFPPLPLSAGHKPKVPQNSLLLNDSHLLHSEVFIFKSQKRAYKTNISHHCNGFGDPAADPPGDPYIPTFASYGLVLPSLGYFIPGNGSITSWDLRSVVIAKILPNNAIPAAYNPDGDIKSIVYCGSNSFIPIALKNSILEPAVDDRGKQDFQYQANLTSSYGITFETCPWIKDKPYFGYLQTQTMWHWFTMPEDQYPGFTYEQNYTHTLNGAWKSYGGVTRETTSETYSPYEGYKIYGSSNTVNSLSIGFYKRPPDVGYDLNAQCIPQQSCSATGSWTYSPTEDNPSNYKVIYKEWLASSGKMLPSLPRSSWLQPEVFVNGASCCPMQGSFSWWYDTSDGGRSGSSTGYSFFNYPTDNGGYFDSYTFEHGIWYATTVWSYYITTGTFQPAQWYPFDVRPIKAVIANPPVNPDADPPAPDVFFESSALWAENEVEEDTVKKYATAGPKPDLEIIRSTTGPGAQILTTIYADFDPTDPRIGLAWFDMRAQLTLSVYDKKWKKWYAYAAYTVNNCLQDNPFYLYIDGWNNYYIDNPYVQGRCKGNFSFNATACFPALTAAPAGQLHISAKIRMEYTSQNLGRFTGVGIGTDCRDSVIWEWEQDC